MLIFLDADRISVQAAGAGCLAGSRAHTAGKLRKAVGLFQAVVSLTPVSGVHQVIPLRNKVVERAAGHHTVHHHTGLAEGDAALHAARALFSLLCLCQRSVELIEVLDALQWCSRLAVYSVIF